MPLHTRDCEPVTSTLQPLSLVEKAEPVQVHFTLNLSKVVTTRFFIVGVFIVKKKIPIMCGPAKFDFIAHKLRL